MKTMCEKLKENRKILWAGFWIVMALLSFFILAKPATAIETYLSTIASINEKQETVAALGVAGAGLSAAVAAIPFDVTTPIANQIMDVSGLLMIVVCVLVLEKSLLTTFGLLSFKLLIPAACVMLGINVFTKKDRIKTAAIKLIVFALALVMIIPTCVKVSDMIYEAGRGEQQVEKIVELTQESEEKSIVEKIKDGLLNAKDWATDKLRRLVDGVALFVICYCAIPVLVVLLFGGVIKILFGVSLPQFEPNKKKISAGKRKSEDAEEAELLEA